jgi:hypothetical protein
VCKSVKDNLYLSLGRPERIWAVSAVHSETARLTRLHDHILEHIRPGDKLVYLGNYTGYGADGAECVDEILTFRRLAMSLPGMLCNDIVYLRGAQEEMWQKLLQIQFAPDPANILLWMLGNGLSNTLYSYGLSPHDGIEACRSGVMGLTKWVGSIREAVRKHPGHDVFAAQYQRAAHTAEHSDYPMLFVNAGIDISKPLSEQGDSLWWADRNFENIHTTYDPFRKVVRGYDPAHGGVKMNCVTATIDGGCGFGGSLVCAGFDSAGEIVEILEA